MVCDAAYVVTLERRSSSVEDVEDVIRHELDNPRIPQDRDYLLIKCNVLHELPLSIDDLQLCYAKDMLELALRSSKKPRTLEVISVTQARFISCLALGSREPLPTPCYVLYPRCNIIGSNIVVVTSVAISAPDPSIGFCDYTSPTC